MIFQKIKLENFRQFLDTEVAFRAASNGTHELIVASNTSGKSTLMAAVSFAFHGTTDLLKVNPDSLSNDEIFRSSGDGNEISTAVQIEFSHGNPTSEYSLRRYIKYTKEGLRETRISEELSLVNKTSGEKISPPQRWIDRNFPSGLSNFLLFPGERLKDFFKQEHLSRIEQDIKTLTGLDRIEPLLSVTRNLANQIDSNLKTIPGEIALRNLIEKQNGCQNQKILIEKQISECRTQIAQNEKELRDISQVLNSKSLESNELKKTTNLRDKFLDAQARVESALQKTSELTSELGWLALFKDSIPNVLKFTRHLQNEKQLGTSWPSANLVEIQEAGRCICGHLLNDEDGSCQKIASLIDTSQNLPNSFAYLSLLNFADGQSLSPAHAKDLWANNQKTLLQAGEDSEAAQLQLAELANSQLSGTETQRLQMQVQRQIDLQEEILPTSRDTLSKMQTSLLELEAELTEHTKALKSLEEAQTSESKLLKQRTALNNVAKSVAKDASDLRENVRVLIESDLSDVIPKAFDQPEIQVRLSRDFEIRLSKYGKAYAPSDGEVVVQGFAFITALYRAAKKVGNENGVAATDIEFPIILDAPFSNTGQTFIRRALKMLSESFPQVILLLKPNDATQVVDELGFTKFANVIQIQKQTTQTGIDDFEQFMGKPISVLRRGSNAICVVAIPLEIK